MNANKLVSTLRRGKSELLGWVTVALFAAPILLDVALNGWKRTFFYFTSDTFYYLTVAQNFALKGFFTFDQQYPTNGFHPLWQVLLGLLYRLAEALSLSQPVILTSVLVINVAFISAAIWLLGKCFIAATGHLPVVFLFLPVGVYGLLISPIYARYNSLYSYANGMESALVILLYAVLMRFAVEPNFLKTNLSAISTGLLLSLLFLARLDHVFFVIALVLLVVAVEPNLLQDRKRLVALLLMGACCAIILVAYLLVNLYMAGMLLPVSGTLKSSFPIPDLGKIPEGLFVVRHLLSHIVHLNPSLSLGYKSLAYRHAQIIVPMAAAIAYLAQLTARFRREPHLERIEFGLAITAIFGLLLGAYNYFFVPIWDQGSWYFPVSVLFVSLFAVSVFERLVDQTTERSAIITGAVTVICVLSFFQFVYKNDVHNQQYAAFFEQAPSIRKYYAQKNESPRLIEFDDGIIAYSTGYPAMSGLGRELDRLAAEHKVNKSLLPLAYQRGYTKIVSLIYFPFDFSSLSYDTSSDELKSQLGQTFFLSPQEVEPFHFRVDYLSEAPPFLIIGMELAEK
jgi:hypothetical protein